MTLEALKASERRVKRLHVGDAVALEVSELRVELPTGRRLWQDAALQVLCGEPLSDGDERQSRLRYTSLL